MAAIFDGKEPFGDIENVRDGVLVRSAMLDSRLQRRQRVRYRICVAMFFREFLLPISYLGDQRRVNTFPKCARLSYFGQTPRVERDALEFSLVQAIRVEILPHPPHAADQFACFSFLLRSEFELIALLLGQAGLHLFQIGEYLGVSREGIEEVFGVAKDQALGPQGLCYPRPSVCLDKALNWIPLEIVAVVGGPGGARCFLQAVLYQSFEEICTPDEFRLLVFEVGSGPLIGRPAFDRGNESTKAFVEVAISFGRGPGWGAIRVKSFLQDAFVALRQSKDGLDPYWRQG